MDTSIQPQLTFAAHQRKRTTSSVLKSIINPRSHQRNQSTDQYANSRTELLASRELTTSNGTPTLPQDHTSTKQQLKEDSRNRENLRLSPAKPIEIYKDKARGTGLHKKTKSSVSLKSLMGNEKGYVAKAKSPKKDNTKPTKSKSSTSLSALLSRPKSSKDLKSGFKPQQKEKENRTPPQTADIAPPPIWAQFATQAFQESTNSRKVPLNDLHNVDDEIAKYTPRDYSPSKQRNFHDFQQPSLAQKTDIKPRPRSAFIPSGTSATSFPEILSSFRKSDDGKRNLEMSNQNHQLRSSVDSSKPTYEARQSRSSGLEKSRQVSDDSSKSGLTMGKSRSRVMAAVAAFNGKAKQPVKPSTKEILDNPIDAKGIDSAFESLLVRIWTFVALACELNSCVGLEKCAPANTRQNASPRH